MGHGIPNKLFREQQGWQQSCSWPRWQGNAGTAPSPLCWELPDSLSESRAPVGTLGPGAETPQNLQRRNKGEEKEVKKKRKKEQIKRKGI